MKSQTAGPIFQRWLHAEIEPFLIGRGWKRRGMVFERAGAGNLGFIEFRRSKWSTSTLYEFMVDVAVFSLRLAEEFASFTGLEIPVTPKPIDSSLSQPLGWLMGERTDVIWRLRAPSLTLELAALGENVRDKIDRYAIPWLEAHASDEQLRDALLEHIAEARSLTLRQVHRLLTDLGPQERLAEIEDLMRTEPKRIAVAFAEALTKGNLVEADEADVRAADEAMHRVG